MHRRLSARVVAAVLAVAPEPAAPSAFSADMDAPRGAGAMMDACPGREPLLLEGRYLLSFASSTRVLGAQGEKKQDPGPITTTLEGTLEAAPGPDEGAAREVALRLHVRAADLSEMADKLGEFGTRPLREAFGLEWRMRVAPRGGLAEATFPREMPPSVQAILHQVAEAAQVAWPERCEAAAAWEETELQLNGPVRASYTRAGRTLRKKFADDQGGGLYRTEGTAQITLDGWRIDGLHHDSETHVRLASDGAAVTVDGTARVRLRREALEAALEFAKAPGSGKLAPFDRKGIAANTQRALDRRSVGGRSFAELVAALEKDSAGSFLERGMARGDLEAMLRLERSRAAEVVALIQSGRAQGAFLRALLESLTETREGADGLAQIFSDPHNKTELRRDAVIASTFAEEPTQTLTRALEASSKKEDRAVMLAAIVAQGGVIAGMRELDPAEGEVLTASFIARAQAVLPEDEIGEGSGAPEDLNLAIAWLQAIAVTAAPEALPILVRALRDEDAWIREHAVYGLRYFPSEETADHLAFILREDPEPGPRERALLAAFEIGRALTFDLVKKALLTDKVNWVRIAAADTIGAWALYRPGLRTVLQAALEKEKDATVRETLMNYITPGRGMENAQRVDPWSHLSGGGD
jgi:hypothetical protein